MPLEQQLITEKLLWLADIEELKQLKVRYAAACDDNSCSPVEQRLRHQPKNSKPYLASRPVPG